MYSNYVPARRAAILLLAGFVGCGAFTSGRKNDGPARIDDLVGNIERVYVDAEVSKETIRSAVEELRLIAAGELGGDPIAAHAHFTSTIEVCEKQEQTFKDSVAPMRKSAEAVFRKWENDLNAFTSAEMKMRSRKRLEETRLRYEQIVDAVDPAGRNFAQLNQGLRDHALFLSHDFNPAALADIQEGVAALTILESELQRDLDLSMGATRLYVQAAALPGGEPPAVVPVSGQAEKSKTVAKATGAAAKE